MNVFLCIVIGYLLGCINPALILGKLKNTNLRKVGTKNLGATNVAMSMGMALGVLIMLLDFLKAILAYHLCQLFFPSTLNAGLIGGLFAIVGHVFPFYLKFKGGKGLATFGGMALAHSPKIFLPLLILCILLMITINHSFIFQFSAGGLFPIFAGLESLSLSVFVICMLAGALIIYKNFGNFLNALSGKDIPVRTFFKEKFQKKSP